MFRSYSYAREAEIYRNLKRLWSSIGAYAEQNIKMIQIIDDLNKRINDLEKRISND